MKRHRIKLICEQCKKEYEVIYSRRKKSKFCSNSCKWAVNVDEKILRKYYCIQKLSIRQIAKLLKVDRNTITIVLKKLNIKTYPIPRYNRIVIKKELKILHYKKHLTLIKIAKHYGCFRSTISNYMKKFNLKILLNTKGKNHWRWMGGLIKAKCFHCKKIIYVDKYQLKNHDHVYCSRKCQGKEHSILMGGTGIPYESTAYPAKFYELREQIRKRDHHTCQKCGHYQSNSNKKLDVHHIDYNKSNLQENNLITLCMGCHRKNNFNRDYWYAYYAYIMENKL